MPPSLAARALARLFVAGTLGVTLAAGSVAATGAVQTNHPADPAASVSLVLAPTEPVIETTDADIDFEVLIQNSGGDAVPAGSLRVELSQNVVTDGQVLGGDELQSAAVIGEIEVDQTDAESTQQVAVTVPRDALGLPEQSAAGVYATRATLQPEGWDDDADADAGAASISSSVAPLVWQGAGSATVPLSIIVPLGLPDDIHTLPTRGELEEHIPALDELLTRALDAQATVAIDPRIIAGIRAYGTEAPEEAIAFLGRMEATSAPSFLLQFGDADPAAQATLGLTELLGPTNLDFVSRFGSFPGEGDGAGGDETEGDGAASEETDTGTPEDVDSSGEQAGSAAESPDPEAEGTGSTESTDSTETTETGDTGDALRATAALPTLEELLSWPAETAPTLWPAEGSADATVFELAAATGYDRVILDSSDVEITGGPVASLEGKTAIVTDAGLGSAAQAALASEEEVERQHGTAQLAAQLALSAQGGSAGIILGLDRGAVANGESAAGLLETVASFDWAEPTPIAEQAGGAARLAAEGGEEEGAEEGGADGEASRTELLTSAVDREGSVNEVGAVLKQPEYLSGYQRTRLLELFATRHASPGADFEEVAAAYQTRDAELLEAVRVISTAHTQLVGASTEVPVQLHNSLPFDATVDVQVDPASAAIILSERGFRGVEVPAEANERLLVPVESRISSGESGIVLNVMAEGGDPTVFTGTLPFTIRSGVETVALWSIGALASLLFAFGIFRSVRRLRRARAERAAAQGSDQDVAPGSTQVAAE